MSQPTKALVVGALNGNFKLALTKIAGINSKHGPFDLLLCIGDFFGTEDYKSADVESLVTGDIKVPIPAYIIGGRNQLPDIVRSAVDRNHGEICEQLMFLGESGLMNTIEGLKIAYLSGASEGSAQYSDATIQSLCEASNSAPHGVDILMTTEWPQGITEGSVSSTKLGDDKSVFHGAGAVAAVASSLQPRYHFACGPGLFFEREPYRNTSGAKHVTRFIGLGEFQSATKQRWFYAMNIAPLSKIDTAQLTALPPSTTSNPFTSGHTNGDGSRKRPADEMSDSFFFNSTTKDNKRSAKGGRRVPPNYVCHKCRQAGHWMEDCPTKMTGAPRVPPDHYVCRLCNVPGHYINDCPQAEKSHRPSGSVDDSLRHRDANQCWFCLSNPQLEKQLIVSVGSEVYLTLAKGGLVDWGGHMLIIPVAHQHSTRQMQMLEGEEGLTAKETLKEMEVFKGKLFDVYAARDEIMVCYELFGGGSAETLAEALQHMHLQVVPLPAALLPDLQPAFLREAEAEGLELVPEGKLPDAVSDMFCRVEIPTGDGRETKVMVFRPSAARIEEHQHMAAEAERTGRRIPRIMNLQFGRKVLASLLGNPAAVDWKRCLLPKAEEEKLAKNMRELVKLDV